MTWKSYLLSTKLIFAIVFATVLASTTAIAAIMIQVQAQGNATGPGDDENVTIIIEGEENVTEGADITEGTGVGGR